ncbi:sulfate ABC transporter permease subunit CysT [Leptolyngbya sp. KIOST-1]|uniref:sulfate ABC transporter permease subunit CysT n=1 Tax=Leptolyngbya sp. KIOST-1 TaxID=1229172 RepID=UPI0005677D08|nr:sulfate ABC transporter permease subunit CysT [Leptolyngbya sp. KIOST-1]
MGKSTGWGRRTGSRVSVGLAIAYASALILLPLAALLFRVTTLAPADFWRMVTTPAALAAYRLTFWSAGLAASINTVAGLVLAWILVRYEFPGRQVANAIVDLPFAMPNAVAGVTLAFLYAPGGPIGRFFDPGTPLAQVFGWMGIAPVQLAYSQFGVILAMVFVSLPFVVRAIQPVLMALGPEVEEAAVTLGATPRQTFWRVILPLLLPALLTGFVLAFSRSVGEYGAVVLLSGNIPFATLTAPVYIYQRLEEYDYGGAAAVSFLMMLLSLAVLLLINMLQAWSQRYDD